MKYGALLDAARDGSEAVVDLRRAIHAEPELGLDCPKTREKLIAAIADLGLEIRESEKTSGFIARLDGKAPSQGKKRTVLLRGDMDALPIKEDTGLDFASRIDGHMHACGHDSHSAMLAGAVRLLAGRRDEFDGTILFMFQPGEEGHGGARVMIEEGLLDDPQPEAAFAIHIWPNLPVGTLACRAGPMLASTDKLNIKVTGKGGHAAMPHDCIDPVPVAAECILALQSEVARRTPVTTDPIVLSVTSVHAGTTFNVLPDAVEMMGTLRALSPEARAKGQAMVSRVVENVAKAHDCKGEVEIEVGYPPTINDPRAVDIVRNIAGEAYVEAPAPSMGGEDFSFVLEKVPGAMGFLGVAPAEGDPFSRPPLHAPNMMINEDALPIGVALHASFALHFLREGFAKA